MALDQGRQAVDKQSATSIQAGSASSEKNRGLLPAISLPRGGGAIRGIGEKFSVNPATGTGSTTVPLVTSPGRSGFGPELSLSYDSGSGNGPFGFGWHLSLPSITRKTDKGLPRYRDGDESDVFLISGAEDLVPILDNTGERIAFPRTVHGISYSIHLYRPRIEGLFARIERWTRTDNGVSHWRSISRDNMTTIFGLNENSRIVDPYDPRRVFSYLIYLSFDDKGNAIHYEYAVDNKVSVNVSAAHESNRTDADRQTQRYLKAVSYGNGQPYFPDWSAEGVETPLPAGWHFQVVLDYGDHSVDAPTPTPDLPWPVRPDPFSVYRAGFEVRTYRRCERALLFHSFQNEASVGKDCLVRSTNFRYSDENSPTDPHNPIYTFLESITQVGYWRRDHGYGQRSTPPLEFFYSQPQVHSDVLTLVDAESRANLPEGLDGTRFRWVDLDGEGLSGILTDQNGTWGYKRNLSPITAAQPSNHAQVRFGPLEQVLSQPALAILSEGQQFLDLSGGGRPDLVVFDGSHPGFFKRTSDGGWEPFHTFSSLPQLDWSDPDLKFVDLTGDGLADVLITEDDVYTFYPSLGETGFGEAERALTPRNEERGPCVVFADGAQTVSLADISGDGLSDLVRMRNGEVCYWPNLGYGRFGTKVIMDGSPRFTDEERFDPRRVRWADVDGSGTADLLYIGDNGVQVCFNRSGNSWAAPQRLAIFPSADSLSSVQVIDLLGTGTACLVWSSPLPGESYAPLRYVDLMGSHKPHLLIRTRNNLGAETRIAYASSTRFYLEDRLAGSPWITRLPFPVQVVERVESYDWIGRSRFVSRYAYHHGYFDGTEREFRGFGMVEQWDTEEHRDDTLFPDVETINEDAASFVPPVRTRTWFHTGALIQEGIVSRQYEHQYWVDPALRGEAPAMVAAREAMQLHDTVLEGGLDSDEIREAYRALKGSTLRVEIYAEDDSPRAENPYTVTEHSFVVRRLQGRGPNQHAVFLTTLRESFVYHYERQPDDPRVTHDIILEVDEFGNALRSVSVAYGRRAGYPEPEPNLSGDFRSMLAHDQTRLHIGATEHMFTDPVNRPEDATIFDAYRAPLPSETIIAELTGITPPATYFSFEKMDEHWASLWDGLHDIPYEDVSTPDVEGVGVPIAFARRIVERTRILYRSNDMTQLLPPGVAESDALPGETYQLALTPGLISRIFGDRVTDAILTEGGYVQLAGQSDWWIPSGRIFYSPGDADSAAQELDEARSHFYQPRRSIDPFKAISRISLDPYSLFPTNSTDALGNTIVAENNYRTLHPFLITDQNGNQSQVEFDGLGQVVGTAAIGKAGEGDSLVGFESDLSDAAIQAARETPLLNSGALLGNATSRIVYDLNAYFRTRDLPVPDAPMVYTLTRETHVSDIAPGQNTRCHHLFVYSDGFGREAQHKAQAEPGPIPGVGDTISPRWVGSGWTIYNNKGKAVRRYEPFFSPTHHFEFNRQVGVSSVLFYDPLERVIATLHPDNTFEKTVFDSWREETWDLNDTALITDPRTDTDIGDYFRRLLGDAPAAFVSWHSRRINGTWGNTPEERSANQDAAQKAAAHASTPTVAHFDSLGRLCLSVADNGNMDSQVRRYATRTTVDTESKPLAIFDAKGRHVMEFCLREPLPDGAGGFRYVAGYDLAGNALYRNSMDSGERRTLLNVVGNSLRTWDGRGFIFRWQYDALHRSTHRFVRSAGSREILVERSIYGEQHPDASRNLKGQVFRHYDGAGVASNERFDFKGNLLESARQFVRHTAILQFSTYDNMEADWSAITNLLALDIAALDAATASILEAERFSAKTVFDAFNRSIQMLTPHTMEGRPSVIQPTYNEANLLEWLDIWIRQPHTPATLLDPKTADLHAVTDLEYNARSQRTRVGFGNSVSTTYQYDPETFRLATLTTTRPNPNPDARVVQALTYTYDPVGNITHLRDNADIHNVVYFNNQRVEPSTDYTYDPLYRLISASGREHLGQNGNVLNAAQQVTNDDTFRMHYTMPGDGKAMGNYTEQYAYDPVGNLLQTIHQLASGGWTQGYAYNETSQITPAEIGNRLSSTSLPGDNASGPYSATYRYDQHGNITRMPHLPSMTWSTLDSLQTTARQQVNVGTPETTFYYYDTKGKRLRKLTDRAALPGQAPRRKSERLYLGVLEVYREYDGNDNLAKERETLHIMDDKDRVALVETRTLDSSNADPAPVQLIRYQYSNHLGSALLELDDRAEIISYEEYFPFGSTAYQAVRSQTETPKRYRYTGKERDEENNLYYHGARYYAPWLGRWVSFDPLEFAHPASTGDITGYAYANDNPIILHDPTGLFSWGKALLTVGIIAGATILSIGTAGLLSPVVGTVAAGIIGGVVGGAAGGAAGELVDAHYEHRQAHVLRSAIIGGVVGGAFAGAAGAIGKALGTETGKNLAFKFLSSATGQAAARFAYRVAGSVVGKGYRAVGRVVEKFVQRPAEVAGEKLAEGIGKRIGGKIGEDMVERAAAQRASRETADAVLRDVAVKPGDPAPGRVRASIRGRVDGEDLTPAVTRSGEKGSTSGQGAIRSPEGELLGPAPKPGETPLVSYPVAGGHGNIVPGGFHGEFKLLGFTLRGLSRGSVGELTLAASAPFCNSCTAAAAQFRTLHPGINLRLLQPSINPAGGVGAAAPKLDSTDRSKDPSPAGNILQFQLQF